MVDVGDKALSRSINQLNKPALAVKVFDGAEAVAACERMGEKAALTPAQHPAWLADWIRHGEAKSVLVALCDGNTPIFALPLDITHQGPVAVGRYMSGRHANGNFPMVSPKYREDTEACSELIIQYLKEEHLGIDVLLLERQQMAVAGIANPFLRYNRMASPDPALAISLDGGLERLFGSPSGKRKLKKQRKRLRKLEEFGPVQTFRARTQTEVEYCLGSFFDWKHAWFDARGIRNPFQPTHVREFFKQLFSDALEMKAPVMVLDSLEVGGKLRAVAGHSIHGDTITCEFSSYADDETLGIGTGEALLHENVRAACEAGFAVYDLSVGDEPYKRSWCDIINTQYDTVIALSTMGKAAALTYKAAKSARRAIKANHTVRKAVRDVRRAVSGGQTG